MSLLSFGIDAVERGLIPDVITRAVIRQMCKQRLRESSCSRTDADSPEFQAFVKSMHVGPIAPVPEMANQQHYELPPEFFAAILGPHRKYSSCFFPTTSTSLAEAETSALEITCQRAGIDEGQTILELGCGWGSLSLWIAGRYRGCRITAVSNSAPQRRFIENEAASRGLTNLHVITADMNEFSAGTHQFDRVVSVEMFEHMRNYELLLERIASWLRPDGRLFVHHFCHRTLAYPYETEGDANWMGRYFFTGGLMPSENMLRQFDRHMTVVDQWRWDGTHYQRTSEAWLTNLDARCGEVLPVLEATYGRGAARRWLHRWRMFFLAVAELFGYSNGSEWFVTHAILQPNGK